ncbi:uncharacterized protein LOC110017864 [Phalaenopsis equestris]|uniref:uncharacterized protein LOC110017864 n=1 Tax=Phalaenopsis equestris TaxID=78828 RepID=UPI0009E23D3A|nr:uncharacterized protein LOC110017864 [Phalaenopsis equestris]
MHQFAVKISVEFVEEGIVDAAIIVFPSWLLKLLPLVSPLLQELLFIINKILSISVAINSDCWEDLEQECQNVFHFGIDVSAAADVEKEEEVRLVWMVVRKGWGGAFMMMGVNGKGRDVGDTGLWFEQELDGLKCCAAAMERGGMVAEAGLVFSGEGRRVKNVSLGLMTRDGCRYVGLREALLYLQSHLLPPPIPG